jgi:hypothetical protein
MLLCFTPTIPGYDSDADPHTVSNVKKIGGLGGLGGLWGDWNVLVRNIMFA